MLASSTESGAGLTTGCGENAGGAAATGRAEASSRSWISSNEGRSPPAKVSTASRIAAM